MPNILNQNPLVIDTNDTNIVQKSIRAIAFQAAAGTDTVTVRRIHATVAVEQIMPSFAGSDLWEFPRSVTNNETPFAFNITFTGASKVFVYH